MFIYSHKHKPTLTYHTCTYHPTSHTHTYPPTHVISPHHTLTLTHPHTHTHTPTHVHIPTSHTHTHTHIPHTLTLTHLHTHTHSPEHRRDSIDLERSLLAPLAGTGQLFVFKMTTGFWSQVKNAGYETMMIPHNSRLTHQYSLLFLRRSAIYANRLYLYSFHKDHPERLATGGPDLPNIIGHVRIHPTAMVDPSATVSE